MRNTILPLLMLCMYLIPAELFGGTYFIAPGGNDSSPGTQTQPWKTIQKAADTISAGDTVLVADGTYAGFYSVRSGAVSSPIIFKADGGDVVISSRNANTNDNVNIEGTDYIVIEGFIIRGAPRAGIRVVESYDVIVRNNKIGPSGRWGIFTGFAPRVQILNNVAFGSAGEHGIYVSNSRTTDDNPIIRGNESYSNNWNGIQVNGDCYAGGDGVITGAIIENNIVHDNGYKGLSLISMPDSEIQNNIIYNNGINGGAGGIHLTDEPGCGRPSNNNLAVNNTIAEPRIAGIRITDAAVNNIIFNNLIVSNTPIADEVGNNNIDTTSNLTRSSTTGLFVNSSAGDYHHASNSPAIDAGRVSYSNKNAPLTDYEGTNRPGGNGYDVGADEYGISTDLNNDGRVDSLDLGILLSQWGVGSGKSADFDGDGDVDEADLITLIGGWTR